MEPLSRLTGAAATAAQFYRITRLSGFRAKSPPLPHSKLRFKFGNPPKAGPYTRG